MSDQTIKAELDPQKVLDALREIGASSEAVAKQIEETLGKDAAKSVKKLEDTVEKGSANIGSFFSNLGKKVKEDLKAAFDFSRVLAGVKFTDEIGNGAKQVLELDRAWDRLNVRLGMSRQHFASLKTEVGKTVSGTGAQLDKVLPGLETVIGRGGVKDASALNAIAGTLSKAQAATGEDTAGLADHAVEAILARGEKVNSQSVKAAVDAAMAARNAGSFQSTTEAAAAIAHLTPFAKQAGLSTRATAGLAAQASAAGAPGVDMLRQLLEQGSQVGGQSRLNALLGSNVFKGGKLDMGGLSGIDLKRFGGLSQQQMAQVTGFSGSSGDDFVRFVNAFKQGNDRFKQVVSGTDETATAFEASTQNLASRLDRFKEKLTNAGREIVGGLTEATEGALSGKGSRVSGGLHQAGAGVVDNAGALAAGTAGTLAMGLLFGGGLKSLLSSGAGTATGIAKGAALKGVGVQSVFVVNSAEIGGASGGALEKTGAFATIGKLATSLGPIGVGLAALTAGGLAGHALANSSVGESFRKGLNNVFGPTDTESDAQKSLKSQEEFRARKAGLDPQTAALVDAVRKGTESAKIRVEQKGPYTNPSSVSPRGGGR
jgi:hypothetical protein